MWHRAYKDYPIDEQVIKYQVEPSHGIIGCEMHEIYGWGNSLHVPVGKFAKRVQPKVLYKSNRMEI